VYDVAALRLDLTFPLSTSGVGVAGFAIASIMLWHFDPIPLAGLPLGFVAV